MVQKLVTSFESDPISLEWFHHSFGLDREKTLHYPGQLGHVFKLFPDTPVKLLKDVCEALQLHDVVELLEKARPRTLRPAFPMKEIEKLSHGRKRSTTLYSKVAALIIDDSTSGTSDEAKRTGSFFEGLSSQNEVIIMTAGPLIKLLEELRELKVAKLRKQGLAERIKSHEKLLEGLQLENRDETVGFPITRAVYVHMQKERLKEMREQCTNINPNIEKEINQKEDELRQEKEKFQRALSTVIDQWVHKEGWLKFDNCKCLFLT